MPPKPEDRSAGAIIAEAVLRLVGAAVCGLLGVCLVILGFSDPFAELAENTSPPTTAGEIFKFATGLLGVAYAVSAVCQLSALLDRQLRPFARWTTIGAVGATGVMIIVILVAEQFR